jgi:hypothetical protein
MQITDRVRKHRTRLRPPRPRDPRCVGNPKNCSPTSPRRAIARETVNRILGDWKRRKLISWASGYYWIENKAQL